MILVDMPAFYLGIQEELEKAARCWEGYEPVPGKAAYSEDSCRPKGTKKKEKKAFDVGSMPVNENILPNITNQAKWKYVRTKDGLKLSDGNLVYGFGGFPDEYPAEDARVSRLDDDNILNFENDALSKGTAQIHRASPDNLYVTLANGAQNPTFMLQHEEGKNWRYSPSKKFVEKLKAVKDKIAPVAEASSHSEATPKTQNSTLIDPESLFKGAEDFIKESYNINEGFLGGSDRAAELINKAIEKSKEFGRSMIDQSVENPIMAMLAGYGTAKGISALRDAIDPSREVKRYMDPSRKFMHEAIPLAAGFLPVAAAGAIRA